jgi:hypothetical protein
LSFPIMPDDLADHAVEFLGLSRMTQVW